MNETENSMGTMQIPKLLVKISVPMMLSLLINSLYGVVDGIFVSRISICASACWLLSFGQIIGPDFYFWIFEVIGHGYGGSRTGNGDRTDGWIRE